MERKVVVFGTSLNPGSKSQILAREVVRRIDEEDVPWELVDLRDLELPESGRRGARESDAAERLKAIVADATHLVFAVAVYNFNVSSAAKNLVELMTADELKDKVVGFVCAAGGRNSYMSVMSFANSLMLDFRAWVVPRYVYAVGSDFDGLRVASAEIHSRLDLLVRDLLDGPPGYRRKARAGSCAMAGEAVA
ncbi:MAG: NADPH-dependent FMN reductase [Thermoanaerobaculia bacterium]|nr:NADPH-dependent FMN reductase [Thermoanaerobaculia bacterium]